MIGKLKGRVDELSEDAVILDVGGVGYQVFCCSRTLAALEAGQAASLIIEMNVREDHIHLYGFPDTAEREWFRLLVSVQGVGNRIALAILGAFAPSQLCNAVLARDTAAFRAISGVGPKLAERIVTELKDKVAKMSAGGVPLPAHTPTGKSRVSSEDARTTEDAISALVNLGYSRSDAFGAVNKAMQTMGGQLSLDQLIRLGLKELVKA